MTIVSRTDEFLDCVSRSELVASGSLAGVRSAATPASAARQLVEAGLLTRFQADVLLKGKHRGFLVGKYKILDLLGSGGMGRVYLCEHTGMGHRVAMKVLPPDAEQSPTTVTRFLREARAAARLNHPNIVRAYDLDRANGHHFIIMDYVDGLTLEAVGSQFGPLDARRAADYISQAAEGLTHIAAAGLTHRDIKPANLMLDETGRVRILDMGLASFADGASHGLTEAANRHVLLGTADYISPEQALAAADADIRSDLYSLGGSLYYLLSGQVPFPGLSLAQKLACHQSKTPAGIWERRPDVPPGLTAVAERLLAKKPEDRYATPAEVVEALREWAEPPLTPLRLKRAPGSESDTRRWAVAATTRPRPVPREAISARLPELTTSSVGHAPASPSSGRSGHAPASPSSGRSGHAPASPSSGRFRSPVAEVLAEAIAAAKAGSRETARQRLAEVIAQDGDNESAWQWLAAVSDSPRAAAACLDRVIAINPANDAARAALARLESETVECPACDLASAGGVGDCPGCGARLKLSPPGDYLTRTAPAGELLAAAEARLAGRGDAESLARLGVVRLNARRPAAALAAFEAALALDPARPELPTYAAELRRYLAQFPTAGRSVLVVGDGATARKLVGITLARAGYAVREAACGEAALAEIARGGAPDVVLADEALPGMGGSGLCAALKATPETAAVPVVLAGPGGYFARTRARRAGAGGYLTRPFRPDELLAAVGPR